MGCTQTESLVCHDVLFDRYCDSEVSGTGARKSLSKAARAGKQVNYGDRHLSWFLDEAGGELRVVSGMLPGCNIGADASGLKLSMEGVARG